MVEPRISIIIPVYNRGTLLKQAIGSCAFQTWQNREVIVVDDGSEEDIPSVIESARRDFGMGGNLACLRQDRRGGNAARNKGMVQAKGDFIQFLDSDDLLHPEKLRIQGERLVEAPHLDMVYCHDEHFREIPGDLRLLWNVTMNQNIRLDLDRFLYEDAVWSTPSPLWRKASLERIGQWNESLIVWQEWEFFVRSLCGGIKYECSDMILDYVRQHRGPRSLDANKRLALEQSRLEAGKLAHRHLVAAGLLTLPRRLILLEFFLKRIESLNQISDIEALSLRSATIEFMRKFAPTRKQQWTLAVLCFLHRTPIFRHLFGIFRKRFSTQFRSDRLRDVVRAFDGSLPRPDFWAKILS